MDNLRFYKIKDDYIQYLANIDSRVLHNKEQKRPYVGIVFKISDFNYFVPMESPKPSHQTIKNGKHIIKLDNGAYGLLGFNNMIPIHKDSLIEFDIDKEQDINYKNLLKQQLRVCNRIKSDIFNHAQKTYFDVIYKKNKFLVSISCDFKLLEEACKTYNKA